MGYDFHCGRCIFALRKQVSTPDIEIQAIIDDLKKLRDFLGNYIHNSLIDKSYKNSQNST